ncbi:hypothetical protein LCGC14_0365280 [marine sediment metagenome]|uniref:Uncharacterized protein n=1 Tax=marine sediment metagenome TaxID=412755 RepID=A0A0F9TPK1_9ZZZZ
MYQITIQGEPVGKARARVVIGKSNIAHAYTPEKTKTQEWLIGYLFKEKYPDVEVDDNLELRLSLL